MSKARLQQAQHSRRDEALASPRTCPPTSRPSEGAAGHPLYSPFPRVDEVGLPGAPRVPGVSGWGGREQGGEGGNGSFGHGGLKGRSRTTRWALLLPGCSHLTPWKVQVFQLGTLRLPIPLQGSRPVRRAV